MLSKKDVKDKKIFKQQNLSNLKYLEISSIAKEGLNKAKMLIFEKVFTSNLIDADYTVGGHDYWDQTISAFVVLDDSSFEPQAINNPKILKINILLSISLSS